MRIGAPTAVPEPIPVIRHGTRPLKASVSATARSLAVAVLVGLAVPVSAETIGYGDAMGILIKACGADVEAHCANVKLGSGRIEACLSQNVGRISPTCVTTYNQVVGLLQARAAALTAAPQVCARDAKRLCSNFRAGDARIVRCLTRADNVRKVGKACSQAITDAGWR
jgi:hypothetical protein